MRLTRPLPLALLAALALTATASPFRSLLGADAETAESETVTEDKASLSDVFPFLTDLGAKSRELDLLNKTTSLRHWDPPTGGCAALLAGFPVGAPASVPNSVVAANGDITLYNPWTPWSCMNGLQVRTLLTVRQVSPDNCKTIDSGFQIQTAAFTLANLPTAAQCNACRPPFCASFGGPGTKKEAFTACQQPFVRSYFDLPGVGTHFQPFGTAQLDWEPEGHAPTGIYDDPHFDFHLYYTSAADVEAIGVGSCSNVGFLSADAWRRSLKPMPAQCFPTGAFTNTALAVSGMGTHLVNVLSPEFKMPFHGFGQTFIFGAYDGRINFVELMASLHWLHANADAGKTLCYKIIGGPKEYYYAGYKPHRYCFEPTPSVTTIRFTDMLWFDAGCKEDKFTVYAAESYAPGIQEALLLNPNCTYDFRPSLAALKTPVQATANKLAGNPIPASAEVVAQARLVERAYSAAAVAGYGAFKAPESLSNDNGAPINKTTQATAVKGMIKASVGR